MNCDNCRIGHYIPANAPYVRKLGEKMMVIPDAPAYACDICGMLIYEPEFMNQLHFLLEHLGDDVQTNKTTRQQMLPEDMVGWQSSRRSR